MIFKLICEEIYFKNKIAQILFIEKSEIQPDKEKLALKNSIELKTIDTECLDFIKPGKIYKIEISES